MANNQNLTYEQAYAMLAQADARYGIVYAPFMHGRVHKVYTPDGQYIGYAMTQSAATVLAGQHYLANL